MAAAATTAMTLAMMAAGMHRLCVCTVKHTHVQGTIEGGPWHGEGCSTVAGEFMPAMCSALATIVQRVGRG